MSFTANARPVSSSALFLHAQAKLEERLLDIKKTFACRCDWQDHEPPQAAHDLIISCLGLPSARPLEESLSALFASLNLGGLFLGVMMGGASLHELRACLLEAEVELRGGAQQRVAPMPQADDVSRLLIGIGFKLPVLDYERVTLVYDSLAALVREMKDTGYAVHNLSYETEENSVLLERASALYAERYPAPGGGIAATVDLLFLHGWHDD